MNIYPIILTGILLICGLTDVIRQIGIGPLTMQGVWTILLALITVLFVVIRQRIPSSTMIAIGFVVFVVIGILSGYLNRPTSSISLKDQAQSLMVYSAFAGSIFLSAGEAYREPVRPPTYLTKGFLWATQLAMIFYGLSMLQGGAGSNTVMSARSFAIFAIIAMAWLLATWRNRSIPYASLYAFGLLVMVAFSLSRTATAICLILYPISQLSPTNARSWLRMGVWIALISLIAYLSFTYVEPIRDRFTDSGDNAKVGGIQINTSGRTTMWEGATASANESPFFGKGPGSVSVPVNQANPASGGHPHNDYLRLRHDFGWFGLTAWLGSYLLILVQCSRYWIWAIRHDPVTQHIYHATLMAMVAVLLMMITDNIVVYQFAMVPLGILIGSSLGLGQARQKLMREVKVMDWVNHLEDSSDINHIPPQQLS